MGKFIQILLLLLLLCFVELTVLTVANLQKELGLNLGSVANKHKHRHSGYSQAECPSACSYRCSKTAYHKPCMFYCQKCCFKCKCVPPGTYAHKEVCPCYNNWKTKRGGPKCP